MSVSLISAGVHSSLGGIVQAAAAYRAGITRVRPLAEQPYTDEESLEQLFVSAHVAANIDPGYEGIARYVQLAKNALRDLESRTLLPQGVFGGRTGLIVCLPDPGEGGEVEDDAQFREFLARFAEVTGAPVTEMSIQATLNGMTGLVNVLGAVNVWMASEKIETCLLLTIDSLVTEERLEQLLLANEIKTSNQPVGRIPGEAAVLLVLKAPDSGRGCRIHVPAPIKGGSLAATMRTALAPLGSVPSQGMLFSHLTGSDLQAAELSSALVGAPDLRPLFQWRHEIAAIGFGDTGVASLPLAIALAARGVERGYYSKGPALILGSTISREHAALLMEWT